MAPIRSSPTPRRPRPRPRGRRRPRILKDPEAAAEAADLRYVQDSDPGIRRVEEEDGFAYVDADGNPVEDPRTLERIEELVIPPAWTDVWICADPRGHLQVTGRDAKGRKQYRYHPDWRAVRDRAKFRGVLAFGRALPKIRARVEEDLARQGLPQEKVLALVVRLLDETCMRVGNTTYASENGTYGLTTLQDEHAEIRRGRVTFHYRGKGGKEHEVDVEDPRLARLVRKCREIPGQELFQFLDDEGERHPVRSEDVNGYLHDITGDSFTAKDFRTWTATVLAARSLREAGGADTKKEREAHVREAVKEVAEQLRNTPRVTRSSYVHPRVLEAYEDGASLDPPSRRARDGLTDEEALVMGFLEAQEPRPAS